MEKLKGKGLDPDTYKKKASELNGGMKKFQHISSLLGAIKDQRNGMLKTLKKHRSHIQGQDIHPDVKSEQLKQLGGMARENRKHFQTQAQKLKAMMTAKKEGGAPPQEKMQVEKDPAMKSSQQQKPQQKPSQQQRQ